MTLAQEVDNAEAQAWTSLRRYKFVMFGYWVGVWVHLNRLLPTRRPNPFRELVAIAKAKEVRRD